MKAALRICLSVGAYLVAVVLVAWLWAEVASKPRAADQFTGLGKMVSIPRDAARYRADLTRSARLYWGLDAPVATFAAQVHQESAWRADARSHVGARGLAQFMPATEKWIAGAYPRELGDGDAWNPTWALRALTRYDLWIWERLPEGAMPDAFPLPQPLSRLRARGDCERMALTLRGYNGGLGWVQKEMRTGQPCRAFRSAANCRENLDYPQRILLRHEPAYVAAGWGPGVCDD